MSAADPTYLASVLDCLEEHVPVQTRPFFGGTGLICDGVQFAMVMGTTLWTAKAPGRPGSSRRKNQLQCWSPT